MICGYEEYLIETKTIYDLIANCFGILCDNISNHQAFIGEYLSEGCKAPNNPNIKRLHEFSKKIMNIVNQYEPSTFEKCRERILEAVSQLELEDYLDEKNNKLTVIYCILSAIDSKSMEWRMQWMQPRLGPLDKNGKTNYRVYFSPRDTLHEEFVDGVKRRRMGSSDFFESFTNFRFIDSRKWKKDIDVPHVQFVRLPIHAIRKFKESRKIKVAVIPGSQIQHFEFRETRGSGLAVEYFTQMQEQMGNRICACIEKSIGEGAHIIVLPEYTVSPIISKMIRESLRNMRRKNGGNANLLLVFAGSKWTDDNNNVMQIWDALGNILGEYYKYSPFTKRQEGEHDFVQ